MSDSHIIANFFAEILDDLDCSSDTKSYIIGIFDKYKNNREDLSKYSITLLFAQARSNHNFYDYQTLGDWLFYSGILFPQHLKYASKEYYDNIAKISYYTCFRLINKQWRLFEELADRYNDLENQVKNNIDKSKLII